MSDIEKINYNSDPIVFHKAYNEYVLQKNKDGIQIALFSSYTIDQLQPFLAIELLKRNIHSSFYNPGYNQYENVLYNLKSNFYENNSDIVFFSLRLEEIYPQFFFEVDDRNQSKVIEIVLTEINKLIEKIKCQTNATIFFSNFLFPRFLPNNFSDSQNDFSHIAAIYEINQKLRIVTNEYSGVYIFDFFSVASEFGFNKIYNDKLYFVASIPYDVKFMQYLSYRLSQYCHALIKPRKKCLVLDLDNTLWGGIIGEDTINGIQLGYDYPGNVYLEIQKIIKSIGQTGILLAINSKNNYEDIKQVFEKHPNSILNIDDFAAVYANWDDKCHNMVKIADELNIGIDSFVFIDDNPVEIGAIEHTLPEITTVQFDKDNVLGNLNKLRELDFFYSLNITQEDIQKNNQYKAQSVRKKMSESFKNIHDFYDSLNIRLTIKKCDSFSLPRISQLTMKTNQFNVTTRRYSEGDIQKFDLDKNKLIYYLKVEDKVGDYGIVGVFIGEIINEDIIIDTLLMSCRIIGRDIELGFLSYLFQKFYDEGYKTIKGEYIKTNKNSVVRDLFKNIGFKYDGSYWIYNLSSKIDIPKWLETIVE